MVFDNVPNSELSVSSDECLGVLCLFIMLIARVTVLIE